MNIRHFAANCSPSSGMICFCVCNLFCSFVIVGFAVGFTVTITLNLLSTQKGHSNSSICHRFLSLSFSLSLIFSLFYSSKWILMMMLLFICIAQLFVYLYFCPQWFVWMVFIHYDSVEILFLCHFLLNETLDWRKQYIFCMVHHEYISSYIVHVDTGCSNNRTNTNFFLLVHVCRHFLRTKLFNFKCKTLLRVKFNSHIVSNETTNNWT